MHSSRRKTWFWSLIGVVLAYAAILFAAGIHNIWLDAQGANHIEGQLIAEEVLMVVFLPVGIFGILTPKLGWKMLLIGAAATVVVVGLLSNSTGDGTGAAAIGGVVLVGIPMVFAALVLLWRSRWRAEPLVGSVRTIGKWGPGYQVIGFAPEENGEQRVSIQILHGGEVTSYPMKDAMKDPLKP